jgi:hypothetical protein
MLRRMKVAMLLADAASVRLAQPRVPQEGIPATRGGGA